MVMQEGFQIVSDTTWWKLLTLQTVAAFLETDRLWLCNLDSLQT